MVVLSQDVSVRHDATFFAENAMARRKAAAPMGRPKAIALTPEQFDVLACALRDSANHLADVAKFMRENQLPDMLVVAAKMMDEHLPAIQAFARRSWAEVGPAATANILGRKTRIEMNQERHARSKARKSQS